MRGTSYQALGVEVARCVAQIWRGPMGTRDEMIHGIGNMRGRVNERSGIAAAEGHKNAPNQRLFRGWLCVPGGPGRSITAAYMRTPFVATSDVQWYRDMVCVWGG